MKKILTFATILVLIVACGNARKRVQDAADVAKEVVATTKEAVAATKAELTGQGDQHGPATAAQIDLTGTYRGELPCANCRAISTELTLGADSKYSMKTIHLSNKKEVKDIVTNYSGTYTWNGDQSLITLGGLNDQPSKYQFANSVLYQLDMEGRMITGELAEKFVLKK